MKRAGKTKTVKPIIPYIGGKSRVATKIISFFPDHHAYCEVFAGGLSVLLAKEPSFKEIVNDYDTELNHLYKMIKFRRGEFEEGLDKIPISRELFETWLRTDSSYMNDVYRAVRKIYLIRLSFGGKGATFGVDSTKGTRFNHESIKKFVGEFQARTVQVVIECLDAVDFIRRYDNPKTFFYLDPVYLGKEFYSQKFGKIDRHIQLRDALAKCRGKWLLSHHDCPKIREIYKGFCFSELTVPYSVHTSKATKGVELLISNY